MKRRILSLLCALFLLCSLTVPALAAAKASHYFGYTDVRAYSMGGGEVLFTVDVDATHTMLEVGADVVAVYEQQPNGEYVIVEIIERVDNDYMTWKNLAYASIDVRYQGIPGRKYYAYIGCYARDASGSEILYFPTNVVTA